MAIANAVRSKKVAMLKQMNSVLVF